MAQPLPRAFRRKQQALDSQKIDRIVGQAADTEASGSAGATAPGDRRRLRGIPIVGRSTSGGAIAGTDPVSAMLAKERRQGVS